MTWLWIILAYVASVGVSWGFAWIYFIPERKVTLYYVPSDLALVTITLLIPGINLIVPFATVLANLYYIVKFNPSFLLKLYGLKVKE